MLAAFELFSYFLALLYSGIWVPEFFTATDNKVEPWAFITTAALSGLLTVYLAFLALGDFQKVFYACHILGTISAGWMIFKAYKGQLKPVSIPFERWQWGLVAMTSLIAFAILFTGITDWQARSVWFFQGKILHFTGSLNSADWRNPYYGFAYTTYPKLYPVIIAFVTTSLHGWNEYAPKWALLILLLPIFTSLFALRLKPSKTVLMFLAILGIPGNSLWNGSPDAYVAAYFSLALLNFAQYQKTSEKIFMLQSLLFIGILPSFTANGLAMTVCFALGLSFFNPVAKNILAERNVSKFVLIPISAFIFWQLRKLEFHFTEQIIPNPEMLTRMMTRLKEVTPFLRILSNTLWAHIDLLSFIVLIAIYFRIQQVRTLAANQIIWLRREHAWILVAGGLYLIFLFLIYWAAPFDIQWYAGALLKDATLSVKFAVIAYMSLCLEPPPATAAVVAQDEGIADLLL